MKVYIIVGGFSGEDHFETVDVPEVFGVFDNLEKARIEFEKIIKEYEETEYYVEDYNVNGIITEFEFTDVDADEHGVIRIVEKEIK